MPRRKQREWDRRSLNPLSGAFWLSDDAPADLRGPLPPHGDPRVYVEAPPDQAGVAAKERAKQERRDDLIRRRREWLAEHFPEDFGGRRSG